MGPDQEGTEPMSETMADKMSDREQVEEVFGLTGGELADEPWKPTDNDGREWTVTYWFDGPPEYAEADFADWSMTTYRTAVRDEMFGLMPDQLTDEEGNWTRVASFRSSGETELPDGSFAYIGDGWGEIVYRLAD